MKHFKRTTLALATALAATHSHANSGVEEMVITATRTPVSVSDSLASVTAVNRAQLEIKQPLDLVDVLQQIPGLDTVRSGGPGSNTSVFTRGNASDHTLVLVDGQRISSATLGVSNLEFLSPEQIERVEVVRGSRSSLYGSDAIGGVIQIFTRDGFNADAGSYISGATGSNSMMKTSAGTSGRHDNWFYGIHGSWLETEGIDNLENDNGLNSDRDGYRNRSVNASVGHQFSDDTVVTLRYLETNNRNEYDNSFNSGERPYSDTRLQNISLSAKTAIASWWNTQLTAGLSTNDSDNFDAETDRNTSNFRTQRTQLYWQNDLALHDDHLLTFGADYYEDEVDSSTQYMTGNGNDVENRDNRALFAQYQGQFQQLDLVVGAREDDHEEFGSHTTGHVAVGFSLNEHYKVIASWSEGFKAPTFNDLYWPAGPYSAGNPDLAPEESENIEVSLRATYEDWYWSLSGFNNDVQNLIDWAAGDDFVWRPYNVSDAEIEGLEVILGGQWFGWQVESSYTYVEPRDGDSDKLLIRRSRNNLTLNANRDYGQWTAGFAIKSQSSRYVDAANTTTVGGYTTVDLKLTYRWSDALKTSASINNALDKDYQLNPGYNQEGRNWQVGVTYQF